MRAPRTLTVLLPLLSVTSPAIGAETTKVPVIRLELRLEVRLEVRFEVLAGCCRISW